MLGWGALSILYVGAFYVLILLSKHVPKVFA